MGTGFENLSLPEIEISEWTEIPYGFSSLTEHTSTYVHISFSYLAPITLSELAPLPISNLAPIPYLT
jgi:hypothetical protein